MQKKKKKLKVYIILLCLMNISNSMLQYIKNYANNTLNFFFTYSKDLFIKIRFK